MVKINGKEKKFEKYPTIAEYLREEEYQTDKIVVELNREILPKSQYDSTELKDGDTVEIVSFVGGG